MKTTTNRLIANIRRATAAVLAALLCLSLCACAGGAGSGDGNERLTVVTTIFPSYDFARQIGGDRADVTLLLPPDTEAHGFELTLQDIAAVQQCDLFICTGGESEQWAEELMPMLAEYNTELLVLTDLTDTLEEELVEGMEAAEEDHDHDHGEAEADEHVWTSPRRAAVITEAICERMCTADPDNEAYYRSNADAYIAQLNALDERLQDISANAARNTLIFAERFPFRYLAEDYGFEYYAAFAGCSSATEPSLSTIAFLTDKVESENIPVVFYIEFSDGKVADTICQATGAKKLQLHSCHNLTKEEAESGETYLSLMERNAEYLREALN
ncbi:MAG: zinc ABC transporter substrate-binding protein [Ruminococcaceae bacterium]|nr:zinc ABC transporter substrate-binding protein [Oscillospiraceae bacterium]